MSDDAPSPSPSRSLSSSSGASRSPSSPRTKRRRTDRYALGFEFAPRLAPYEVQSSPDRIPSPEAPPPPQRAAPEWTEGSTFALLDAWGDRFVRSGRRGVRAEDWLEVARLATAADGRPAGYFSESQCRNRIDTLRKKFKKEKERLRIAARRSRPTTSKWVYFDKLMSILYPPPPPPPPSQPSPSPPPPPPPLLLSHFVTRRRDTRPSPRLSWGRDAPERMLGGGGDTGPRDSRMDVEFGGEQKPEPAPQSRNGFAVFSKSIQKFGDVIQRLESRKRQHMAEVEQMRKDFHRDLDAKLREILERAQAEIACLEDGYESDEEDGDGSDGNNRLEYVGGQGPNNGTMDTSHRT